MITYAEAKRKALAVYPHYDKCTDCGNVWAFGTNRAMDGETFLMRMDNVEVNDLIDQCCEVNPK